MSRRFSALALGLATVSIVSPSHAGFVPNELIVTLVPDTPAARALKRAATGGGKAQLDALEHRVLDVAGAQTPPLRVGRVMSGRAVLVRLDTDAIGARLLDAVRRKPWVAAAELAPVPGREVPAQVEARIVADSSAHAALAETSTADRWLRDLEGELTRETHMPVRAARAEAERITVSTDWATLTLDTKSWLAERPGVESVDLNVIMQHQRPPLAR